MILKRAVILFVVTVITCSAFCIAPLKANAEEYNGYTYTVFDKKVEITGCDKNISGEIIVPEKISENTVTKIGHKILKGIDVSAHQDAINWTSVKAAGVQFAILRLGYGDNDTNQDDSRFAENVAGCEANGIPWGAYIYSYALNTNEANSEADHCLRLLNGKKPTFPICFDMEDADGYKSRHGGITKETAVAICETFLDKMQNNGYYVSLYASLSWLDGILNDSRLDRFDKWVAQWNDKCEYEKPYGIWQYGGSVNYLEPATVDGISTNVDKDFAYKDYPTIIKSRGRNGWQANTKNVTANDFGAFQNRTNITKVTLPDTVEYISASAFQNCTSLTQINIPKNIKEIGECAFYGCDNLETVVFEGTMSEWDDISIASGNSALQNAKKVYTAASDGSIDWEYNNNTGTLYISGTGEIKDYSSQNPAPWNIFKDCTQSIVIEDNVTKIGEYAFCDFSSLSKIVIPNSVADIGNSAFPDNGSFTIYCNSNTQTEQYAIKNGIKCVNTVQGDMNEDLLFNDQDAIYLLFSYFYPEAYHVIKSPDVNGDGAFTDQDAIHLLFCYYFPESYSINENPKDNF